jgi:hypothetical protein
MQARASTSAAPEEVVQIDDEEVDDERAVSVSKLVVRKFTFCCCAFDVIDFCFECLGSQWNHSSRYEEAHRSWIQYYGRCCSCTEEKLDPDQRSL